MTEHQVADEVLLNPIIAQEETLEEGKEDYEIPADDTPTPELPTAAAPVNMLLSSGLSLSSSSESATTTSENPPSSNVVQEKENTLDKRAVASSIVTDEKHFDLGESREVTNNPLSPVDMFSGLSISSPVEEPTPVSGVVPGVVEEPTVSSGDPGRTGGVSQEYDDDEEASGEDPFASITTIDSPSLIPSSGQVIEESVDEPLKDAPVDDHSHGSSDMLNT